MKKCGGINHELRKVPEFRRGNVVMSCKKCNRALKHTKSSVMGKRRKFSGLSISSGEVRPSKYLSFLFCLKYQLFDIAEASKIIHIYLPSTGCRMLH